MNTALLEQLINSMSDALKKLEEAKMKGDSDNFNRNKKLIIDMQKKIKEETEKA
ncbi:MAG: hypothetical protein ACOYT4_01910 [Nanoarchaeota archaeon]